MSMHPELPIDAIQVPPHATNDRNDHSQTACSTLDPAVWICCEIPLNGTAIDIQTRVGPRSGALQGAERISRIDRSPGAMPHMAPLRIMGSDLTGAVVLSAVAGYVDTAGFMALFGLFTAHITGDLVTAGTSLGGQPNLGANARLLMIPIFIASVAATTLFARRLNRWGYPTLPPTLALLTFALSAFGLAGVMLHPLANQPDAWAVVITGGAGVIAMGIQNTLTRSVLSSCSPTTIMTGNLTQCTIDLVEMALPDPANDTVGRLLARGEAGARLKKYGLPLLGFTLGALSGGAVTHCFGLASISVPAVAVAALTVLALHDSLHRVRSASTVKGAVFNKANLCSRPRRHCIELHKGSTHSEGQLVALDPTTKRQCNYSGVYPHLGTRAP